MNPPNTKINFLPIHDPLPNFIRRSKLGNRKQTITLATIVRGSCPGVDGVLSARSKMLSCPKILPGIQLAQIRVDVGGDRKVDGSRHEPHPQDRKSVV